MASSVSESYEGWNEFLNDYDTDLELLSADILSEEWSDKDPHESIWGFIPYKLTSSYKHIGTLEGSNKLQVTLAKALAVLVIGLIGKTNAALTSAVFTIFVDYAPKTVYTKTKVYGKQVGKTITFKHVIYTYSDQKRTKLKCTQTKYYSVKTR